MRKHVLGALCAALALSTPPAGATHEPLAFTYMVSPTTAGSVSDASWWVSSPAPFTSTVVHTAPGEKWAHADDGTSPVFPAPMHGDLVGSINRTSDLLVNGCGAGDNQAYTLSWVEPIGSGAPSGTVAEFKVGGSFLGLTLSKRMFVVLHGGHYDVVTPDWPDELTCSSSPVSETVTVYGYARTALGGSTWRIVHANPSLPGTYTVYFVAGSQTASDSYTVT